MKECYFDYGKICKALTVKDCVGCKFMKTIKEFVESNDKAVERCRKLGLCDKCEYSNKKCLKSTEI